MECGKTSVSPKVAMCSIAGPLAVVFFAPSEMRMAAGIFAAVWLGVGMLRNGTLAIADILQMRASLDTPAPETAV